MDKLKRKRILICAGAGVLAFVVVFGVLLLTHKKLDYSDALADTEMILATRDAMAAVIDSNDELTEEKQVMFDTALARAAEAMDALGQRTSQKDEEVATAFKNAQEKFVHLQQIAKVEQVLANLTSMKEIDDEALAELKNLDNEFLNAMLKELDDYKKEVAVFSEKYADAGNINDDELIEAYGNIQVKGEELVDKYTDVGFEKIFGISRAEALSFYDDVEELHEKIGSRL